jgi:DegV family protein with EDD domain
MIKLFTDTSANLPLETIKKYGIQVLAFEYTVDGVTADYSYETDFDGERFYNSMRQGADVKTCLISMGKFIDAFEPELEQGNDVIYVGMSGGISSTASVAAISAAELQEKYPERHILAFDTLAASLGEGLFVLRAAELIEQGADFQAVSDMLFSMQPNMCQYFTVDDLKYLRKGGRISGAAAVIGSVLNIKPILQGDEAGRIIVNNKIRGRKNALKHLAELYDQTVADRAGQIGISHADDIASAEHLLELLRQKGFTGDCITVMYEPVTGSHVGPGTVALFYPGIHK